MKKTFLFVSFLILSLSFMIGCQSDKANKNVNTETTNNKVFNNQDIDYERLGKIAIDKVNQLDIDDVEIRKWVIRAVAGAETFNQTLTDSEILKKATDMMNDDEEWFKLAEKYGVKIPDSEVRKYIDELYSNIETIKQLNDFANGLEWI